MCPLQQAMIAAQLPLSTWPYLGTADELMRALSQLPLACQPGERWLYHMSSEILGVLIARVSGQSLGGFMQERIFEPLGMKDTGFLVPAAELHRIPTCYGLDFATGNLVVLDKAEGGHASRPPAFESGGGGLVSTVDDLLAFSQMMLNSGIHNGRRILSRPAIELMTTDHITADQKAASPFFKDYWRDHSWGFGVGLVTGRGDLAGVPGRFGWDGAFGTSCWIDPREQLIGIFMSQRRPDTLGLPPAILDFWTSAYQLIED
jgi:CubicO group peptidase (beta-lactamase class C family)